MGVALKWWYRLIVISVPLLTVLAFVAWNERSGWWFSFSASAATVMLVANFVLVEWLRVESREWEDCARDAGVEPWEGPRPGKDDET